MQTLKMAVSSIAILAVLFLLGCGAQPAPTATPDFAATSAAATAQANGEATRIAVAVAQALTAAAPTATLTPTQTPTPSVTPTPSQTPTPPPTNTPTNTRTLTPTPAPTNTPLPTDTPPPTATVRPRPTNTRTPDLSVDFKVIGYQTWGRPYVDANGLCQSTNDPVRMLTLEVVVANQSQTPLTEREWTDRQAWNNLGAPVILSCWFTAPPIPPGQTGITAIKIWVENNQFVSRVFLRIRGFTFERCFDLLARPISC